MNKEIIKFIIDYPNYIKFICELPLVEIIDQLDYDSLGYDQPLEYEKLFLEKMQMTDHDEIKISDGCNRVFFSLKDFKLIFVASDSHIQPVVTFSELEEIKTRVSSELLNFI